MGTYKTVYRILEMNIHNFTYRIIDTKTKKHCSKDGNDNDNDDNNAEQQQSDSYYPYQPKNNSRARCSKSMHVNSIINMQVKKNKSCALVLTIDNTYDNKKKSKKATRVQKDITAATNVASSSITSITSINNN